MSTVMHSTPALRAADVIGTAITVTISAAQVAANLSGVPYLSGVAGVISEINSLWEKVQGNRNAAKLLCNRCAYLAWALYTEYYQTNPPSAKLNEAIERVQEVIRGVHARMLAWVQLKTWKSLMMQSKIKDEIDQCNGTINACCEGLQITAQAVMLNNQQVLFEAHQKDQEETLEYLAKIDTTVTGTAEDVRTLMELLQSVLRGIPSTGLTGPRRDALSGKLHNLQLASNQLLPDLSLQRGVEIQQVGNYCVAGDGSFDVFEGLYLSREKVAMKKLRGCTLDQKSRRRFDREMEVWRIVYGDDGGHHVLPFYGVFWEGVVPFVVSPWMQNGTAIEYVKRLGDEVDHRALVKGVAEGIMVLHRMNPPICHANIRGASVVINDFGTPLLADFGLSRVIEDTGAAHTMSGVSESSRWFAPELLMEAGDSDSPVTLKIDVFAFGMTVLELMTHAKPHAEVKRASEVIIRTASARNPKRPTAPEVLKRGLDDRMWQLLLECWKFDRNARPSIEQVYREL